MYNNAGTNAVPFNISISGNTKDAENPVTAARSRIAATHERINTEANRVAQIADVQFGGSAPAMGSTADNPSRSGEAGRLHDDLDRLWDAVCVLSGQIDRLALLGLDTTAPSTLNLKR